MGVAKMEEEEEVVVEREAMRPVVAMRVATEAEVTEEATRVAAMVAAESEDVEMASVW